MLLGPRRALPGVLSEHKISVARPYCAGDIYVRTFPLCYLILLRATPSTPRAARFASCARAPSRCGAQREEAPEAVSLATVSLRPLTLRR